MKKLSTILLFCILTVGMVSVASAEDWRLIGADNANGTVWYFDTQSFIETTDTTYSVLVKQQLTKAYGKKLSNEYSFKEPIAYLLDKYEFNYTNNQFRILSSTYYTEKHTVIYAINNSTNWHNNSLAVYADTLFTLTYDYYKKHYK